MQQLCLKLIEYAELPQPYAYPYVGGERKLSKLDWENFRDIPYLHWRKLAADLQNIQDQKIIVDFALNKVCYEPNSGFIFLACYDGDQALDWDSSIVWDKIIFGIFRSAAKQELAMKTLYQKRKLYREVVELFLALREINNTNLDDIPRTRIDMQLTKFMSIYLGKLTKTDHLETDNSNQPYTLSVSAGSH
jgi:23S rRNA C2498 (ribose-2'-O)-methylase RlmM